MPSIPQPQLNSAVLDALGGQVAEVVSTETAYPLEVRLVDDRLLRIYVLTMTNPPGGRKDEHKIQAIVPGQGRQARGNWDTSGGAAVLVAGFEPNLDAFVLWDANLHKDFPYSKNMQVKTPTIEAALQTGEIVTQERKVTLGLETVLAAPAARLWETIEIRLQGPVPAHPPGVHVPPAAGGQPYQPPPRNAAAEKPKTLVYETDPDVVDRGTTAHKDVQDAVAEVLTENGIQPLSPAPADPQFDVAWVIDGVAYVGEVKSLTEANEEKQLRLGLGQVLTYAHLLDWVHAPVTRPVLIVEREPTEAYWATLCAELGVILAWPEAFETLLEQ